MDATTTTPQNETVFGLRNGLNGLKRRLDAGYRHLSLKRNEATPENLDSSQSTHVELRDIDNRYLVWEYLRPFYIFEC